MALKFLDSSGSGSISDAIEAVNYATMMKQKGQNVLLTNNSWGGGGFSQGLSDAIKASGTAGQLFVAAAGNNGQDIDASPFYPAGYDLANIISVAATDHNDALASFSNFGVKGVDLAAPGVNIWSTKANNSYQSLSGTSMASPQVAGAAALIWSKFPTLTNAQVKDKILTTVDPKPSLTGKVLTGGRLNLFKALGGTEKPGQIWGYKWNDINKNGKWDQSTEPGLKGWTIYPGQTHLIFQN